MSRYILSPLAIQDLETTYDYIASNNIDAAERFVDAVEQKCETLANFPNMGKSYAGFMPQLRGVPVGNYTIFYRPIENGIEVVRVLSGYRDLEAIFSDQDDDNSN